MCRKIYIDSRPTVGIIDICWNMNLDMLDILESHHMELIYTVFILLVTSGMDVIFNGSLDY